MKSVRIVLFSVALLSVDSANAIEVATVPIGNPGNAPDFRYSQPQFNYRPNGIGAVDYSYRIGTTEVTNAQYVTFLNAVAATDPERLYSTSMATDTRGGIVRSGALGSYSYAVKPAGLGGAYTYADKPVVFVNVGDAMRFANWLHNGQPTGSQNATTTEDGAYLLAGATTDFRLASVTRNPTARWWLPSEDEWYKAAYHKNDGVSGNYWDFPNGRNDQPNNNPPTADTGNSANFEYDSFTTGNMSFPMTDAGAYPLSHSPYGTFDQGGNVWEWTDTVLYGSYPAILGGSWSYSEGWLYAAYGLAPNPSREEFGIGFRVATVPEPTGVWLCAAACWLIGAAGRRSMRFGKRFHSARPHVGATA
jgi:formylglycine-generating enzyme